MSHKEHGLNIDTVKPKNIIEPVELNTLSCHHGLSLFELEKQACPCSQIVHAKVETKPKRSTIIHQKF